MKSQELHWLLYHVVCGTRIFRILVSASDQSIERKYQYDISSRQNVSDCKTEMQAFKIIFKRDYLFTTEQPDFYLCQFRLSFQSRLEILIAKWGGSNLTPTVSDFD
eukprot:UN23303